VVVVLFCVKNSFDGFKSVKLLFAAAFIEYSCLYKYLSLSGILARQQLKRLPSKLPKDPWNPIYKAKNALH
jgi:hypothetical protein